MLKKMRWSGLLSLLSLLSWPAFPSAAEPQTGCGQTWSRAWTEAWSGDWGFSRIEGGELIAPPGDFAELSAASVIALVGLAFEARIAAGPGVLVICRGGDCRAAEVLPVAAQHGCRSIISFGVAGGLAPDLVPGDCVVASTIIDYPIVRATDPMWSGQLLELIPEARHGPVVGVNSVVSNPADKQKLHDLTGAVAVDMESHLVARLAASHGLSFASVRVVIDPADRVVPPAALVAMAPGGGTDVASLLWEILARPSQVAALVRIAADAYAARAALLRLRRVLGPDFRCG
jgi:adenosylhomocysteine nucleosidase